MIEPLAATDEAFWAMVAGVCAVLGLPAVAWGLAVGIRSAYRSHRNRLINVGVDQQKSADTASEEEKRLVRLEQSATVLNALDGKLDAQTGELKQLMTTGHGELSKKIDSVAAKVSTMTDEFHGMDKRLIKVEERVETLTGVCPLFERQPPPKEGG